MVHDFAHDCGMFDEGGGIAGFHETAEFAEAVLEFVALCDLHGVD